jgi:cytochrome c2
VLPPAVNEYTGDLSHTSRAAEFDTLDQVLKRARTGHVFNVPGEHDTSIDDGKQYLERYGNNRKGRGWYSFTHKDVHFVGLVNAAAFEGLGKLGADQLRWLEADLRSQPSSRPVVVFAHVPLWSVYPEWGWGTEDSAEALGLLKRFGSVTVLNGHIHQAMRKIEGQVTFHTAMSTAFPQPAPGAAKGPGPMKVEDDRLRSLLGVTDVSAHAGAHGLAIVDDSLSAETAVDGRDLFARRCGGCHSLDRDKEGPRLGGVYGRDAGSLNSFEYSDALKRSKTRWSDETLNRWLADPESFVPGTEMSGFRVDKPGERAAIIAYLKRTSAK